MPQEVPRSIMEKEVFGAISKVPVWRLVSQKSIEPPQEFSQNELREELEGQVSQSQVNKELGRLEKIGAIRRFEGMGSMRSVWYVRTDPLFFGQE